MLISIDGMHALDFANCASSIAGINGGAPYCPNLSVLSEHGAIYTQTSTSRPSDDFPGLTDLVTGGSPRSTGLFYNVSYDRSLSPPAKRTPYGIPGGAALCPSVVGTQIGFDEQLDIDMTRLDAGGGINPDYLPRDPKNNCAPVYPHSFIRVNTLFEVVNFEPAQYDRIALRLAKQAEESAATEGRTAKFPARLAAATISGRPALTSHIEVSTGHDTGRTFDGVYLCAANALIALTAFKDGDAPGAGAELDRVRTSLRFASTVPRAKKPWENAAPFAAPFSAQKAADGTVWKLFSGLSPTPATSSPVAEEAWQNSWDTFAREVQASYAPNAAPAEFAQRFNGRRVAWEGVVDLMDTIDHLEEVGMPIQMPKKLIRLPDGQTCPLDRLQLSFGAGARVPVDETFRFRATLDCGSAPAVFVGTWPGQKTRAIIVKASARGELIK